MRTAVNKAMSEPVDLTLTGLIVECLGSGSIETLERSLRSALEDPGGRLDSIMIRRMQ